ncbi:MAG: RadC family protein [Clostridia bacterium]|nr:RadC family protein [Clostridia bacterium]
MAEKNKNIHAGHRQRMRKNFQSGGFKGWHDHNVLEYILFRVIPRADTNEIAHHLIDGCGGFAEVFRASKEKLTDIMGVGDETAEYLRMLGEFVRYYNDVRYDVNRFTLDSETSEGYMLNLFDGMERENFYIFCLDAQNRIIYKRRMFEGSFDSMDIDISQILRLAAKCDASNVVLAHNHPSGIAKASNADIVATQAIERALSYAGVGLLDHIIVAGGKCASAKRNYIVPDTRKYKK